MKKQMKEYDPSWRGSGPDVAGMHLERLRPCKSSICPSTRFSDQPIGIRAKPVNYTGRMACTTYVDMQTNTSPAGLRMLLKHSPGRKMECTMEQNRVFLSPARAVAGYVHERSGTEDCKSSTASVRPATTSWARPVMRAAKGRSCCLWVTGQALSSHFAVLWLQVQVGTVDATALCMSFWLCTHCFGRRIGGGECLTARFCTRR